MAQSTKFPLGLNSLDGDTKGAVKILFYSDSGLELYLQETPLTTRLKDWIDKFSKDPDSQPRIAILVGGPGNGKTQTVNEVLTHCLKLYNITECPDWLKDKANSGNRSFYIDTKELGAKTSGRKDIVIKVVQDASTKEPNKNKEESFLEELKEIENQESNHAYICCINKGILDDSMNYMQKIHNEHKLLIKQILKACSICADRIKCWPLQDYPQVGIWPMDRESLLESQGNKSCVFDNILSSIFDDEDNWEFYSDNKSLDPFFYNRSLMLDKSSRKAFIRTLRWYELATGQRLSFRDLFSLISYLFAFTDNIGGKTNQKNNNIESFLRKTINDSENKDKNGFKSLFILLGCLYSQKLFSFRVSKKEISNLSKLWKELSKTQAFGQLSNNYSDFIQYLFNYLKKSRSTSSPSCNEHLSKIDDLLTPTEYEPDSDDNVWNDLYGNFSHSVQDGLEYLKENDLFVSMYYAEKVILEHLQTIDSELGELKYSVKQSCDIQPLQFFLRRFACSLARISIGVRTATLKDKTLFESYHQIVLEHWNGIFNFGDIERSLESLLNDPRNEDKFSGTLNKTFGQISPSGVMKASLLASNCSVSCYETENEDELNNYAPKSAYPFFVIEIGNNNSLAYIPLTFDLYRAVELLKKDLSNASLPRSVIARIDTCRALILGASARDVDQIKRGRVSIQIGPHKIDCRKMNFTLE